MSDNTCGDDNDWEAMELIAKTRQLPKSDQALIKIVVMFMSGTHLLTDEWEALQKEYLSK